MPHTRLLLVLASCLTAAAASTSAAQPSPSATQASNDPRLTAAVAPADRVTLTYANRPITELRARVLTAMPVDRAQAVTTILDRLVNDDISGPVTLSEAAGVVTLQVAERDVLNLVPADLDELSGLTLRQKAERAAELLAVALAEADELRTPGRLLQSALQALAGAAVFLAAMYLLRLVYRRAHRKVFATTDRAMAQLMPGMQPGEPAAVVARILNVLITVVTLGLAALFIYGWVTFTLRRFPYTRPWGESLRSRLLEILTEVGVNVVEAIPGLTIVLIIIAITRLLVQVSNAFFKGIEAGRISAGWSHPETAGATRRIVATVLWLFALVLSYPYLPGSGSAAFQGVSVFVGLVVSLGSSGIVNQLMSGLTLIYSRALKAGDIVRIGDKEGMVTGMSLLSVKIQTFKGDEVTVPNAVVIGDSTVNYSKTAPAGGSYLMTGVTIGYGTPWRQVRALLLMAAERTSNVRHDPAPRVLQDALEEFYVRYRLLVCLEDPLDYVDTRDRLHASIQDVFNEFGVQIMAPSYEADPEAPKVVPVDRWFEEPAARSDKDATPE